MGQIPIIVGMSLVEVDSRFRVTIPSEIRKKVEIREGQAFYLVPYEHGLLMKPVPKNASRKLAELIGDFKFDRRTRRKAEQWLLKQAQKS